MTIDTICSTLRRDSLIRPYPTSPFGSPLSPPTCAGLLGAGCLLAGLLATPAPAQAQDNVSRPADQSHSEQSSSRRPTGREAASRSSESDDDDNDRDEDAESASTRTSTAAAGDDETGDTPDTPDEATDEKADAPIEADNPVDYCDQFMKPYLESSARKLYRALAGRDYEFQTLSLQDWVELDVRQPDGGTRTVEFEVFRQKDGNVAGLVDTRREYRRTLVVTMLDVGPVITSYAWPDPEAVDNRGDCRPTTSRIDYPVVPADDVDPEPFKFWGLRVIWRLPKSFDRGDQHRENLYETIAEVLKAERNPSGN